MVSKITQMLLSFKLILGSKKGPQNQRPDYGQAFVGGRSRRKSAVKNNTESRFSSWVIKRIQEKDPKNGPEKNTCFVDF